MRRHPRGAETDAQSPRAWATCDQCGLIFNHFKLRWRHEWAGTRLINLNLLVCPTCLDEPQPQLRTIVLPPDPNPMFNARPEPYSIDEASPPSPPVPRFAASRARWLTNSDLTKTQIMTRSGHKSWTAITSLRIAAPNVRNSPVDILNDFAGEFGFGNAATVTASIEYPAGVFTQIKFSGSATGSIADTQVLISDAVTMPGAGIPTGTIFWVRMFWQNVNGVFYNNWQNTATYGDAVHAAASGLSDQTMGGTVADNTGWSFPPAAIIANTNLRSIGIVGDSISYGNGLDDPAPYLGATGTIAQALVAADLPFQNLSQCGARAYAGSPTRYWLNGKAKRALLPYCSDVVFGLGINDLDNADGSGTRSATDLASDIAALANALVASYSLPAATKRLQTTITPMSTSIDGWTSVAGQTASTQGGATQPAERVAFNTAVRAASIAPDGFFDIASTLESSLNSGLWLVYGGINRLTDSNTFNTANWFQNQSSVATTGISDPFGGTGAWSLVEDSSNGVHYLSHPAGLNLAAGSYTFSVYAKLHNRRLEMRVADIGGSNFAYVVFDLSGGQVGTTGTGGAGFSNLSSSITAVSNGWYRCVASFSWTVVMTGAFFVPDNGTGTAALSQSYVGDGASGVYLMDAQIENGTSVSAYTSATPIPTTLDGLHPTTAGYTLANVAVNVGSL